MDSFSSCKGKATQAIGAMLHPSCSAVSGVTFGVLYWRSVKRLLGRLWFALVLSSVLWRVYGDLKHLLGYVFHGEQCFQQNCMDESMKLFTPQAPDWQIMFSTCTVWMWIFNIVWENNATRKSQLRSCEESFLLCAVDAPSKFWSTSEFRSASKTSWSFSLLIFPCVSSSGGTWVFSLSCPWRLCHLVVVFSGDSSFTGSCPLGGMDPNCVVCEFPMQMVRHNKLEFGEILYSLHILVQKLNCGKWNNVPVPAWWELIGKVATTASFQL